MLRIVPSMSDSSTVPLPVDGCVRFRVARDDGGQLQSVGGVNELEESRVVGDGVLRLRVELDHGAIITGVLVRADHQLHRLGGLGSRPNAIVCHVALLSFLRRGRGIASRWESFGGFRVGDGALR